MVNAAKAQAANTQAKQTQLAETRVADTGTNTSSAHIDTFARNHLPPRDLWPEFIFTRPELQYPERLNCVGSISRSLGRAWPWRRPLRH